MLDAPNVDWRQFVHSDKGVLAGKPVVRGTRLAVDFILELFAAGWTAQQMLDNYPTLTPEAIRGVFAYAAESLRDAAPTSISVEV